MQLVVLIKQVPMVSELPWNKKTGELLRDRAEGMMNPACKHALEAALRLKERSGGRIIAISMGPPAAEEVLREALALGADQAYLVSDSSLAGADTLATSRSLAQAVRSIAPRFDLLFMGCHTSDSETGQVGPQMAEILDLPAVCHAEGFELMDGKLQVKRVWDDFLETVEMPLPGLLTIATSAHTPRNLALGGVERAFADCEVKMLSAKDIGADPEMTGRKGSAGQINRVYSPTADKQGELLTGAVKKCVNELFARHSDRLGGLIGKDLGEAS
jgi:electron transfer flavoprotein beta subunit